MDIAKIRKKAREKELKSEQQKGEVVQDRVPGPMERPAAEGETTAPDIQEQAEDLSKGGDQAEERGHLPEDHETGSVAVLPLPEGPGEEPQEEETMPSDGMGSVIELLTFSLAEKEFAFRIADVEEIIPYQGITFVPLLPDYVSGIMSLRGKIIPVVDLKSRFALCQTPHRATFSSNPSTNGRKEKILILSGPKGLIGATVDKIKGVVRFPEDSLLAPPAHLTEEERKFIDGVVILEKRFISVIRFRDTMTVEAG